MRQFVIDTLKARDPNRAVEATPEELAKVKAKIAEMQAEEAERQARARAAAPPEGGVDG